MCVIQSWPQLSHLTLPAGVRVSSEIFRQVGSKHQFSSLKMVTDNCLQLDSVNFPEERSSNIMLIQNQQLEDSNLMVVQRGNHTVMTN